MKMKPANRISKISAESQQFLQNRICAKRSSEESLGIWLIRAKQWLWSACAFAQADLSHCLAGMSSCRKCCGPANFMPFEQVWSEIKVELPNLCWSPGFIASTWLRAWFLFKNGMHCSALSENMSLPWTSGELKKPSRKKEKSTKPLLQ